MNARKWLCKNGIRGRDPRHAKSHLMFSRNILTITQVFWEIFCGLTRQKHSIKTTSYEQSNGGLSVWLGVTGTMNLSTRKSWRKMPGHKFVAEAQAHLIMHQDKRKTSSRAPLWTGIVQTEIWLKCVRMTSDRLLMLSSPPVKLKQSCSLKGARLASKMRKTRCKWSQILDCKFWRQGWHKNY